MLPESNKSVQNSGIDLKESTMPCIICLKVVDVEKSHNFSKLNLKVLHRYLKMGDCSNNNFQICTDCSRIVDAFCSLYAEMKNIKLKLEWKVSTLQNVMVCADRVPSRQSVFQEYYSGGDFQKMEEGKTWRRRIKKKCSHKLSKRFPRVLLSKLKTNTFNRQKIMPNTTNKTDSNCKISRLQLPRSDPTSTPHSKLASLRNLADQAEKLVQVAATTTKPGAVVQPSTKEDNGESLKESLDNIDSESDYEMDDDAPDSPEGSEGEDSSDESDADADENIKTGEDFFKTETYSPMSGSDNSYFSCEDEPDKSTEKVVRNCAANFKSILRCPECLVAFSNGSKLASHMQTHMRMEYF